MIQKFEMERTMIFEIFQYLNFQKKYIIRDTKVLSHEKHIAQNILKVDILMKLRGSREIIIFFILNHILVNMVS